MRRRSALAARLATAVLVLAGSLCATWLCADAVAFFAGRDREAPPQPLAGDRFAVSDLEWSDAGRQRRVPVRLFWPQAVQGGKVPLIVFSHGIGSSRDGYNYLGRYWARHGVASLHLQHVGSDRTLWRGDVSGLLSRFQRAAGDQEAIARVQDFSFALDRLLQSGYGEHIDAARIVAAGHSYGANTTLLAAGARVMRNGRELAFRDARISAAILISAPPFYGESDFGPILSAITIPTLHITTAQDVIRIPGFGSGVDDRLKVFSATGSAFKALAIYREGSHNVFTDRRYFDSLAVADQVKSATEDLSLAFLAQVYSQQDSLRGWKDEHAALMSAYLQFGTVQAALPAAARLAAQ
ncbi:alpha/beta hydrolase family protein [Tahibacter aquaticus]|uniref:alpha/beta hydrolase family protein n=1 Tax=Tahibacter aquaticus TaxID=520092 RepID=UPI001AAD3C0E|nr:alpha/beta fold hydrolase [Tahibacter aquaticus]